MNPSNSRSAASNPFARAGSFARNALACCESTCGSNSAACSATSTGVVGDPVSFRRSSAAGPNSRVKYSA